MNNTIGAIVLAAGKGKRMNSTTVNKVALSLGDKPMIVHTVELLEQFDFGATILVVGFAKESVREALQGRKVIYANQVDQLGTANAVLAGLKVLPKNITDVLVIQGDDSALYQKDIFEKLIKKHQDLGSSLTFLTLELKNPEGLGRVVRNSSGELVSIVEEKDATQDQKNIQEVNPACYVFKVDFLHTYLPKVEKSPVTQEYYLTSLIDLALQNGEKIATLKAENLSWRGVNTPQELQEAEKLFLSKT